ncbi:MAG TPA: hypothetical protein VF950_20045 [Planctomycetota bacterium]
MAFGILALLLAQENVSFEPKLLVRGVPNTNSGGWGIAVSPDGRSGVLSGSEAFWGDIKLPGTPMDVVQFLADGRPVARFAGQNGWRIFTGTEVSAEVVSPKPAVLSRNRQVVGYISASGKESYGAVIAGKAVEGTYLDAWDLVLSPDGKRWAMVVRERGADKTLYDHAVVDGVKGPPIRGISKLQFSDDGSSVGYASQTTAVIDGETHGPFTHVDFALGHTGVGPTLWWRQKGKWSILTGGKSREYDRIDKVRVSEDGRVAAFVAVTADGKSRVVIGDKEGPAYAEIGDLVMSRDGKRVLYAAKEDPGGRWLVVDGDRPESARFGLRIDRLTVAPGGGGYAYLGVTFKEPSVLMANGVRGPAGVLPTHEFVVSPDGKTLAFVGLMKSERILYHAGKPGNKVGEINSLTLSADGKAVAYRLQNSGMFVNRTQQLPEDNLTVVNRVGPPVFSPDGKKVAYAAFNSGGNRGLHWKVAPVK